MKNITVVGAGYVGLSNAMLFSKQHAVTLLEIDSVKVNLLNKKISPIQDLLIEEYLAESINFLATDSSSEAYSNADIIIIATPTNYDEIQNFFDTQSIEQVLSTLSGLKNQAIIVIKSTVPVGFTAKMQRQYPHLKIIFSPEFLREGSALFDNLYPSRIVVGNKSHLGETIADLFKQATLKKDVPTLLLDPTEAEAVKLFSNTYLAMRVAFFNELDSYCMNQDLNSRDIIEAVCLDPRIGNHYNNPSFGYGGYCLPKDTKQLLANYQDVPQNLIAAIIHSNKTRKDFITQKILEKKPTTVGIYRLVMKQGSDNFRKSAIQGIIKRLKANNVNIVVYEPNLPDEKYHDLKVIKEIEQFKQLSDLIIVNRNHVELNDVKDKVFTRDIFGEN